MMAHVAEASEFSGRVLVWTDRGAPLNTVAAQAAARLAAAFNAEIETISVSRSDVPDLRDVPFARIAVQNGGAMSTRPCSADALKIQELSARKQRRDIASAARPFGVICRHTEAAGDPIDILSELCLVRGPWNVVVAAGSPCVAATGTLFANISGATGVVAAPQRLLHPDGPVAVVAEDLDRLAPMLRAAKKLTRMFSRIRVLPAASTRDELGALEAHCRLIAASQPEIQIETTEPGFDVEGAFDMALRRMNASFVVSRFGGSLLPTVRSLTRTIEMAGAPFLLVR